MKRLYLGLDSSRYKEEVISCSIIKTVPSSPLKCKKYFNFVASSSHLLLTSRTALFFTFQSFFNLSDKMFLLIGKATEEALLERGNFKRRVAPHETSEGVIELLETLDLSSAHLFYPHSARARPLVSEYLTQKKIKTVECVLYDTIPNPEFPRPDLSDFDEIIFTSPSTVDAFLYFYKDFPNHKRLTALGPITQKYLEKKIISSNV